MITKERLSDIFGKFVGAEAAMEPGDKEIDLNGTKVKVANDVLTPKTFKLMSDVREAAAENGLTARVIWPHTVGAPADSDTHVELFLVEDARGRLLLSLDADTVPTPTPDHASVTRQGLNTPLKPLKPPRFKPPTA